jgi:Protein of unknown function (DUF1236)
MSKVKLLTTAAAIALLGGGAVMAQGLAPAGKDNPARAPAAQQNAPAEKMGPAIQHGQRKLPETTGQATPDKVEPGHGTNVQSPMHKNVPAAAGANIKEQGKAENERHGPSSAQTGAEHNAQGRGEHNEHVGGNTDHNRVTTGQGAAGSAHLSQEQRTRMSTFFHHHTDHRIDKARLNISIRVGARVPTSVHFYPVPVEIVDIYPEWRGYDYVYVGDEILIVDPRTHEIVAILEA